MKHSIIVKYTLLTKLYALALMYELDDKIAYNIDNI